MLPRIADAFPSASRHLNYAISGGVLIPNIVFNHLDGFQLAGKALTVIAFPLQNAPAALHWTFPEHASLYEPVVGCSVGMLVSSVAVEQGMGFGIGLYSLVKGLIDKWIVIAPTHYT